MCGCKRDRGGQPSHLPGCHIHVLPRLHFAMCSCGWPPGCDTRRNAEGHRGESAKSAQARAITGGGCERLGETGLVASPSVLGPHGAWVETCAEMEEASRDGQGKEASTNAVSCADKWGFSSCGATFTGFGSSSVSQKRWAGKIGPLLVPLSFIQMPIYCSNHRQLNTRTPSLLSN